LSERLG